MDESRRKEATTNVRHRLGASIAAVIAAVTITSVAVVVPSVTRDGGAPPAVTANLWVDADGGSCTFSAAKVVYVDASACASTAAAYTAADHSSRAASTVAIRAGRYGPQTIPDSTRTGGDISFVEGNGDVTLASLAIYGDRTSWVGETIDDGLTTEGSQGTRMKGATFDGVSARGGAGIGAWWINNAQDLVFKNGEICCGQSTSAVNREGIRTGPGDAAHAVSNLTIDHTDIHDWSRDAGLPHTECALLLSVQKLVISNSHFWNCAVYSLSLGRLAADLDPKDTLIENNTFAPSDKLTPGDQAGNSNIVLDHVGVRYDNLVFRNNSFSQPIEIDTADVPDATGYDRTTIESNILPAQAQCAPEGTTSPTYAYNVMTTGATCGTNATAVASPLDAYASHKPAGRWDFRLVSGSPAIGKGSPTQSSRSDLAGCARDDTPDAGAYEFGACLASLLYKSPSPRDTR
jgi:hypothetical protein